MELQDTTTKRYVEGEDRRVQTLLPPSIEECIGEDNPVRFIDAFIESIRDSLGDMGFSHTISKAKGRKAFDPCTMLKLYVYGYFYGIRSSRKLERESLINLEVIWLLQNLKPDFHTIANFRRDNKAAMKNVFKAFNKCCIEEEILRLNTVSIDGSKFQACNSKDKNFSKNKLDDRLVNIKAHIQEFMTALDNNDEDDETPLSKEELLEKIDMYEKRKELYEGYLKELEESGESQLSLNDPESKLMKTRYGFGVSYNTQTAVDVETHLVAGFNVTDKATDHGQITPTISEIKEDAEEVVGKEIKINAIADMGYQDHKDMADSFELGIVPNVIPEKGKEITTISYDYVEKEITQEMIDSKKPSDISDCLHAGVVPSIYKNVLEFKETSDKVYYEYENTDAGVTQMSEDEMMEKALQGFFVRNAEANYVICPQGQILRQKSVKKDGSIRYCNKLACKNCKNKCTKAKFKEADFNKDTLIRPAPGNKAEKTKKIGLKRVKKTKTLAHYSFKLDLDRLAYRMSTSEHVFGSVKRWMNSGFLLCKGKVAAEAENSLSFLAYNMKRIISLGKMKQLMCKFALK